jgi:hypothetical protein
MIDMRSLRKFAVSDSTQEAPFRSIPALTLQAGLIWKDVLPALQLLNLTAVHGQCTGVGISGFSLHGGVHFGGLSELYGLASDNILAATIVVANGSIITLSNNECIVDGSHLQWELESTDIEEDRNEIKGKIRSCGELWFGIRGAGSSFGIVTDLRVRLHRVRTNAAPLMQMTHLLGRQMMFLNAPSYWGLIKNEIKYRLNIFASQLATRLRDEPVPTLKQSDTTNKAAKKVDVPFIPKYATPQHDSFLDELLLGPIIVEQNDHTSWPVNTKAFEGIRLETALCVLSVRLKDVPRVVFFLEQYMNSISDSVSLTFFGLSAYFKAAAFILKFTSSLPTLPEKIYHVFRRKWYKSFSRQRNVKDKFIHFVVEASRIHFNDQSENLVEYLSSIPMTDGENNSSVVAAVTYAWTSSHGMWHVPSYGGVWGSGHAYGAASMAVGLDDQSNLLAALFRTYAAHLGSNKSSQTFCSDCVLVMHRVGEGLRAGGLSHLKFRGGPSELGDKIYPKINDPIWKTMFVNKSSAILEDYGTSFHPFRKNATLWSEIDCGLFNRHKIVDEWFSFIKMLVSRPKIHSLRLSALLFRKYNSLVSYSPSRDANIETEEGDDEFNDAARAVRENIQELNSIWSEKDGSESFGDRQESAVPSDHRDIQGGQLNAWEKCSNFLLSAQTHLDSATKPERRFHYVNVPGTSSDQRAEQHYGSTNFQRLRDAADVWDPIDAFQGQQRVKHTMSEQVDESLTKRNTQCVNDYRRKANQDGFVIAVSVSALLAFLKRRHMSEFIWKFVIRIMARNV